ncbi:cellulose synthase/poly-beta-1,6-N-acetylglucosamine synthase-like glycosyltransferase/peptidoglycan/xylan/chitin deacetylase (PgdA/CDA1 family)/spore germination protein YaaH [Sphingomonas sp. BE138]|uniref:glycosyltransferase n=1 Tax=Sphingomonas sp. BE138 TaxID=2817845 RepID=UPI0028678405|nr:glycosyltransferase [Sphingomonas sp. BE138]MDR6789987.1 cellulose synthase/poly-beta-1,6-N-acetylglucosamine synthase-like glycosyltransferase/peptidoglycan/xylan/chitin deacetylase (PgdA/CDA1 family)/spore germination protein YaaH [Sphingomonas sp. BE138]
MTRPIFFDPTGRRSRMSKRVLAVLLVVIMVSAAVFALTLVRVPRGRDLALPLPQPRAAALRTEASLGRGLAGWLPHHRAAVDPHTPLSVGFYVPGDDASIASLRRHSASLDWVVPATISVFGAGHRVQVQPDPQFDRMIAAMKHAPKVLPMVQNFGDSDWDGAGAAALLHDPRAASAFAGKLGRYVAATHRAGLVMDFETLPARAMPDYLRFLRTLRAALPKGAPLAVTVPAEDDAWPLAAFARVSDKLIFMAYDQHWEGGTPGPIAGQSWFVDQVARAMRTIGRDKLVVALGSYGYDWHGDDTDALSIEDAWLAAHDSQATVTFDRNSGNAGFAYDEDGQRHTIWMLDAASSWNEMVALKQLGIDDIALWRLGSEDPGFWADLTAWRTGGTPDLSTPRALLNADVEGSGEILRITATPTPGVRRVTRNPQGILVDEKYPVLPTPYVVQRTGAQNPKLLALTFDDGPDATWTPKILRELEQAHVPGTFFVIGQNALEEPGLLNRIVADGGEIGNHTYSHPNLAAVSDRQARLEINTTQRLVEAYTGRRMTLFRAPYFGDAEPTTTDELGPALIAQNLGYTVTGLHVDPDDWARPGTDHVVNQVLDQVRNATPTNSGNIILLHDGGGDRSETVAALPRIIAALKAEGYRFVTVSQLAGLDQAQAMPKVEGRDLLAVRADVAMFVVLAGVVALIGWLSYLAIGLGMARAVLMAVLAWIQSRRRRGEPPHYTPTVSVIIPAYNEERVIASSVARVLSSDYPDLQVIVADDGSKDGTSAAVRAAFADDPRVTLLTLENGGKAAALNRALLQATGEVVIALDADTQFEPETIARLVRWFADPRLGAVAGDARVGNRVNLVTRWQAIEYITAQNLERRALAGFDAMTVVPGAVGAWRRAALDAVGGYPEDTLAEDQDLTIAIQRAGWRVTYDPRAVAWTEAPETFRALAKQRYRWAFGTLQCLWKHRAILRTRKPSGLALVGLPQAWLFQILFAAISPLIDLTLVMSIVGTALRIHQHGWAQTSGDVSKMGLYWLAFTAVEVVCGWIAYRLDGNKARYPALLLIAQRLVYRQIMYGVVIRAISSAVRGMVVGWGKLERTGRVAAPAH